MKEPQRVLLEVARIPARETTKMKPALDDSLPMMRSSQSTLQRSMPTQTIVSIFRAIVDHFHGLLRAIADIPAPSLTFDHDILMDTKFCDDSQDCSTAESSTPASSPGENFRPNFEGRALRRQLKEIKTQLNEVKLQLNVANMENRACQFDITRLNARVHDLEDELAVYQRRFARQETQLEQLQGDQENLERRNSGLWLINAGLRYDLTEIIVGKDDGEMVHEVVREVEKEELEEVGEETLIEVNSRSDRNRGRGAG